MNKIQKIWLWVSLAMFLIPEIFFSFMTSFIFDLFRLNNFPPLYQIFINPQFFIDNSIYLFIALGIEFLGALGFLIWNIKFNNHKYKIFLTIVTTLILVFLVFIFFVGYSVTNMSFP